MKNSGEVNVSQTAAHLNHDDAIQKFIVSTFGKRAQFKDTNAIDVYAKPEWTKEVLHFRNARNIVAHLMLNTNIFSVHVFGWMHTKIENHATSFHANRIA